MSNMIKQIKYNSVPAENSNDVFVAFSLLTMASATHRIPYCNCFQPRKLTNHCLHNAEEQDSTGSQGFYSHYFVIHFTLFYKLLYNRNFEKENLMFCKDLLLNHQVNKTSRRICLPYNHSFKFYNHNYITNLKAIVVIK